MLEQWAEIHLLLTYFDGRLTFHLQNRPDPQEPVTAQQWVAQSPSTDRLGLVVVDPDPSRLVRGIPSLRSQPRGKGNTTHSENHTTRLIQLLVAETMAAGQKAVIDLQDVAGNDGSLETALVAWTGRHGPVIYNKWQ